MRYRIIQRSAGVVLAIAFVLGASGASGGTAQAAPNGDRSAPVDAALFDAIDDDLRVQLDQLDVPGMSLGIVHGNQIVHLAGFGDADDSGRRVTPQTPFYVGSISKSFTALAVMQLVESGAIELDAAVRTYLPWFGLADLQASQDITVRQLLNQTSGIPAESGYFWQDNKNGDDALEAAVRSLRGVALDRPVGRTFEYSNANYTTLGLIVQVVSGQSYEQYVEEHILTPLDMTNSFMSVPEAQRNGLVTEHRYWFGHPFSGGGLPVNRAITPAGLIISDAEDMSHYLIAQLNGGSYQGVQLLSTQGIAELHRGNADVGGGDLYAMGWVNSVGVDDQRFVWHNGDTGGSQAYMAALPESSWGVVLLSNGSNDLRPTAIDAVAQRVLAQLLGYEPAPIPGLFDEQLTSIVLALLAVSALQLLGIARSAVLVRRWRAHPERRPRGAVRILGRLAVPLVLNLAWALVSLVIVPASLGSSLWEALQQPSDIALIVLLPGIVALIWGVIVRPALALLVLRSRPPADHDDDPNPIHAGQGSGRRRASALASAVAISLVLAMLAGCSGQPSGEPSPKPGDLYQVAGETMHLQCEGRGSPTVVMLGGQGDTTTAWADFRTALGPDVRTCAWDYPGVGWSTGAPMMTAARAADALDATLLAAGIPRPVMLVGHSIAGLTIRLYVGEHPSDVSGVVLFDPTVPSFARAYDEAEFRPGWDGTTSADQVEEVTAWPDIPFEILRHDPAVYEEGEIWSAAVEARWVAAEEAFAALAPHGTVSMAPGSGHYIYVDAPSLSIAAVRRVLIPTN